MITRGLIEKVALMAATWCLDRLGRRSDEQLDKRIDDRINARFRARAEKYARERAQITQPQIETVPATGFDPWSAQPPADAPMGSLLGLDLEKARRDRLIKAMMGGAQ